MANAALPTPWPGAYTAPTVRTSMVAQGVISGDTTAKLNEIAQVEKGLVWFNPKIAPLTRILNKLKNARSVENFRFYHLEKQKLPRRVVISDVHAGSATTPTALTVDSGEGSRVRVNDLLYNLNTADVCLVTAVSGDELTVTANIGDSSPGGTLYAADNVLLNIGNAYLDGSGSGSPIHTIEDEKQFFTQIFKDAIEQSDRYQKTALYEGDAWTNARRQCEFEHLLSLEHAFLLGKASVTRDSTTGKIRSTMAGLKSLVSVNVVNIGGDTSITKAFMDSVLREAMRMGDSGYENREMGVKTLFGSQLWLGALNTVAEAQIRITEASEKTFGLQIAQYQGPWGVLNLINTPVLNQSGLSGEAYILDLAHIRPVNFKGRDTAFKGKLEDNDLDGNKAGYVSDKGLELEISPAHTRLYGLA